MKFSEGTLIDLCRFKLILKGMLSIPTSIQYLWGNGKCFVILLKHALVDAQNKKPGGDEIPKDEVFFNGMSNGDYISLVEVH